MAFGSQSPSKDPILNIEESYVVDDQWIVTVECSGIVMPLTERSLRERNLRGSGKPFACPNTIIERCGGMAPSETEIVAPEYLQSE